MNILLINQNYQLRGGADRYYFETKRILEQHGHHVIPFSTKHKNNFASDYEQYFSRISGAGYEIPTMPTIKKIQIFLNTIYSFEASNQLENLLEYHKPDIAHTHNLLHHLTPSIIPVIKRHNIPIVQSLHDWHIICGGAALYTNDGFCERCKGGKFYNCFLHKCDHQSYLASAAAMMAKYVDKALNLWQSGVDLYAVPNRYMVDKLEDWGFSRENFYTIPNPFSLDDLTPSYQLGSYVVWYGRLSAAKGVFTLLRAAELCPDIRFELYGSSGPAENLVRKYIDENNLKNINLDTKLRWGEELKSRISNALCVIDPSEWPHPSQYVLWESQALGKAVIASNIGGTPDLIKDEINGSLINVGDWQALAGKIIFLKNNRDIADRWGRAARKSIELLSDQDGFYNRLMEIYLFAIEKSRDRSGVGVS